MGERRKVAVIGSGPAGLSAAHRAAELGAETTVFEARRALGGKLPVSGAGKCNFTNMLSAAELAAGMGVNWRFTRCAIGENTPEEFRAFLTSKGVGCELVDGFYCFPATGKAADVLAALKHPGVRYVTGGTAVGLTTSGDLVSGVTFADGSSVAADAVVWATGGVGWPLPGAADEKAVYGAIRSIGHPVETPTPALVGLKLAERRLDALAGTVLDGAELSCGSVRTRGALLFTGDGISGPAALDISGTVLRRLAESGEGAVTLRWRGGEDRAVWDERLLSGRVSDGRKQLANFVGRFLTSRCAEIVCDLAGASPDEPLNRLTAADRRRLADALGGTRLAVTGCDGWRKAMVTRGGVSVREVESRTMRSRLFGNLYFAGEVLDVDGPCGGYNIQWAFASGRLAGGNAAR